MSDQTHTMRDYRLGCRCEDCRAANRLRAAQGRAQRLAAGRLSHGTRSAYDAGCRCPDCLQVRRDVYARDEGYRPHRWRELVHETWSLATIAREEQREAATNGWAEEGRQFDEQHPPPRFGDYLRVMAGLLTNPTPPEQEQHMSDTPNTPPGDRWNFSKAVTAKASRLVKGGRVTRGLHTGVYYVEGSGPHPYRVQTDATTDARKVMWVTCNCQHGQHTRGGRAKCSHAVAVLYAIREGIELAQEQDR